MEITKALIFKALGSDDQFPIDFDDAWRWVGYQKKESAFRKLEKYFFEKIDYIHLEKIASPFGEAIKGGQNRVVIYMTIDCFKSFCMMAGTPKGQEVRRYFIECENRLKLLLQDPVSQKIKLTLIDSIVSKDVVSTKPKFMDWFYDMIYRKRGRGWQNRSVKYRPPCVGTWTNDIVYNRMLGGTSEQSVKSRLVEAEPKVNGVRRNPLHSHLSEGFGEKYLEEHFKTLQIIDKLTPDGDWDRFMYNIKKIFPSDDTELQLNLLYELERFQSNVD